MRINLPKVTVEELAKAFCISRTTAFNWLSDDKEQFQEDTQYISPNTPYHNNNLKKGLIIFYFFSVRDYTIIARVFINRIIDKHLTWRGILTWKKALAFLNIQK